MTESVIGIDSDGKAVKIDQGDRREGLYIIGSTGTGKSVLIENLVMQDINQGLGVCLIDPHGDLINGVISRINKRLEDVILIDLDSREYVAGLNLFHCDNPDDAFLFENVVQAFMHIFEKVYEISRETPLLNQFFLNIVKTMIYNPTATILDVPRLLTDWNFRTELLKNIPESEYNVKWFWIDFYERLNKATRLMDAISAVSNKLVEFESRVLKPWFGQKTQTFNLRKIMDERKILLVKLKARWESINSLIGSILIAQILDAAYSRQDTLKTKRKQFNVYADEFQSYASRDFAQLFTEARKYGIGITIAHQVFEQIDLSIKATIKQAANIVVLRVSSDNAKEIAGEFDTTPPPGEWIYEKVMQRAKEEYQVKVWSSPEAEEEHTQLIAKLVAPQQVPVITPPARDIYLPAPNSFSVSRSQLSTYIKYMQEWFALDIKDKNVFSYYKSLYEVRHPPTWGHKRIEGVLYPKSYYQDYYGNKHPHNQIVNDGKRTSAYYAIPSHIKAGEHYCFPSHLPCVFEREQRGQLPDDLIEEIKIMYAPFKQRSYYLFDPDLYNKQLYWGYLYTDTNPEAFAKPWTGPFLSDADWIQILKWFYKKAEEYAKPRREVRKAHQAIEEMHNRLTYLEQNFYRYETRDRELGWYEPVPVIDWDVLSELKANAHFHRDEYLVGDNIKYTRRMGPPPYGSDEVEKRTANQIKQLPKYTARVRIATGEYTIATEEPKGYCKQKELEERIRAIQQQNVTDGYLRLRSDVEQELADRHALLLKSSATQQYSSRKPPTNGARKVQQPAQPVVKNQQQPKPKLEDLARRVPDPTPQPLPQKMGRKAKNTPN